MKLVIFWTTFTNSLLSSYYGLIHWQLKWVIGQRFGIFKLSHFNSKKHIWQLVFQLNNSFLLLRALLGSFDLLKQISWLDVQQLHPVVKLDLIIIFRQLSRQLWGQQLIRFNLNNCVPVGILFFQDAYKFVIGTFRLWSPMESLEIKPDDRSFQQAPEIKDLELRRKYLYGNNIPLNDGLDFCAMKYEYWDLNNRCIWSPFYKSSFYTVDNKLLTNAEQPVKTVKNNDLPVWVTSI